MTLEDFMQHMKHRSLSIKISDADNLLYDGDVGSYSNSVAKANLNKRHICIITCDDNLLHIKLKRN